jgi:hypothetical protein
MNGDLQFPVGKPELKQQLTTEERMQLIENVAQMPKRLSASVAGLSAGQLDTPYRPGGWTVRQVVHHLADSHMNSFVRFKLALTEDKPTIKTYEEALWAETADAKTPPIELSIGLLESLHTRWVLLMRSLTPEEWSRKVTHPERGVVTLDENLCLYSWHSRHHVAHITALREREGWN